MRGPQPAIADAKADPANAFGDTLRQRSETLRDGGCAPLGHHFHADRRHLHRDEMVALAHVETPCIRDIAKVREIDRVLGAHVAAAGRRLIQRKAIVMTLRNIDERPAVGPEQPLVGRKDHKVRIEARDIHRQHAGTVRRVDEKDGVLSLQRRRRQRRRRSAAVRQCTDEIDARPTGGAPGRSIAARTADVQSPSSGRRTVSTVNPSASARVRHSSTGEEWSSSRTMTRAPRAIVHNFAAVATRS